MVTPDWNEEFEIMCDVSDYAMGAVLAQRTKKIFKAIYYASKTFNKAQENYSKTKKKMLAMCLLVKNSGLTYWGPMS